MMSNQPSSLQQQPRQFHRRQNSTPVIAFEAMKVSNNMPTTTQRQGVHRRGQSFDQHQRSPIRRQPGNFVSTTNQGQHILREAQQLRTARPGQHVSDQPVYSQCVPYSGSTPDSHFDNVTMGTAMPKSQSMQFPPSPYFTYNTSPAMSPTQGNFPMGRVDENSQHYFQNVHSNQDPNFPFDSRRMSQPDMRMRPHTPADQVQMGFPLTPPCTTTATQQSAYFSRGQQHTPPMYSPNPVSVQRGRSLQGIVEHDESPRTQHGSPHRHLQHNLLPLPAKDESFDMAEMPTPGRTGNVSPSPMTDLSDPIGFFTNSVKNSSPIASSPLKSRPAPILTSTHDRTNSQSPTRPALSPRRASISDLHLEPGIQASIEETNVTLDDIAQYIDGPDPVDNKWVCNFDGCDKRFGRKENIKSHVQTHLGDRQFRCDHCRKCFVRGHDLKRHAKIHTGTKPYPCLCGNSFARHDALTRHRQRGMCIGAFEGTVRKPQKRGRPRKHRPEMDDRMDKASRSRQSHDMAMYASSSSSGASPGSWDSPPTDDNGSVRDSSPFGDMAFFGMPNSNNLSLNTDAASFPPEMFTFTPPESPQYSTGNHPSPAQGSPRTSHLGDHRHELTQATQIMDETHLLPPAPDHSMSGPGLQGTTSHRNETRSLPALSQTSSSPPPEMVAFDFADMPMSSSVMQTGLAQTEKADDRNEFDAFLDYGYAGTDMMGDDSFFTMS